MHCSRIVLALSSQRPRSTSGVRSAATDVSAHTHRSPRTVFFIFALFSPCSRWAAPELIGSLDEPGGIKAAAVEFTTPPAREALRVFLILALFSLCSRFAVALICQSTWLQRIALLRFFGRSPDAQNAFTSFLLCSRLVLCLLARAHRLATGARLRFLGRDRGFNATG